MASNQVYTQAATAVKAARPNKSHTIIDELKHGAHEEISITNPLADMLETAAKHIEWLELLVTGITGRERQTIAKLTRRVGTLERMVANRDTKINEYKDVLALVKREFKENDKKRERRHRRKLKEAAFVGGETRHQIEKNFIKDLQTGFEKGNALSQARWEGRSKAIALGATAADGGWHQYIQS